MAGERFAFDLLNIEHKDVERALKKAVILLSFWRREPAAALRGF